MKIKKLNISVETGDREFKLRQGLNPPFVIVEQQWNVIEDKINEIIEVLNKEGGE